MKRRKERMDLSRERCSVVRLFSHDPQIGRQIGGTKHRLLVFLGVSHFKTELIEYF